MECLQIDWKNIDGTFEKDDFYENIQAPKWIDFTVPPQPVDDHAWFCGKTGCTHEAKTVLQALNQRSADPFEASITPANMLDPLTTKTLSTGVAVKKTRAVVSSSLSSLSDLKAVYAKHKVLHHKQMPSIVESKGGTTKDNRQQQASENQNPNRAFKGPDGACKAQDAACKKPSIRALEVPGRQKKMSESKGIFGKEVIARVPNRDTSIRSMKTLSEQVSLSQTGPVLEASKSVFVFGKRDPMHAESTLNKIVDKELPSDWSSKSEAKNKKAGGTRFFSRPSPTARNPYLSTSLAMPIVRRSAANARPLHGVYLGNDKVAECKPPRVTKDVRVTVQAHACQKRNDHKKEALTLKEGKLQERDHQRDRELKKNDTALLSKEQEPRPPLLVKNDEVEIRSKDSIVVAHTKSREEQHMQRESKEGESICDMESLAPPIVQDQGNLSIDEDYLLALSNCVEDKQLPHPFQGVVEESTANNIMEESKSNNIQTREKEDSITNTLEKFLENLQITPHEHEMVSNEKVCESEQNSDCMTEKIISNMISAKGPEMLEYAIEQDSIQTHGHVDNDVLIQHEAVISDHADCAAERDSAPSHSEENALEHDIKNNALKKAVRCSHNSTELLQMIEPLSSKDGSKPSPATLHMRSNDCVEVLSIENDTRRKKIQHKQNLQFTKDWQRHTGAKRKSSELNLNCLSKDHKHETQKVPLTRSHVSSLLCQQVKQSSSTTELPMMPASQPHGLQDSCEEHHKKLKTTTQQAFKPFRFRTEERGALKELGLGKKESVVPNSKEMVHHALRMPSFGRPFRPQRSTKKLTIPREPKFHVSRTKNTCTNLATTSLASSS